VKVASLSSLSTTIFDNSGLSAPFLTAIYSSWGVPTSSPTRIPTLAPTATPTTAAPR
jgi:hypothetical protein